MVAGGIYYLDSSGSVHRLIASGQNQVVAKFPLLTNQQLTSFAVKPDGTQLMASLDAFPPLIPSQTCPQHAPGDVTETLVVAKAGGRTTTVASRHVPFGKTAVHLTAVVGWDAAGPVAVTELGVAYIGFIDGTVWLGPAAHLDATGLPATRIGGSDCDPRFGGLPDGRLVCYDALHPTVRDPAGRILWPLKPLADADNLTYGYISLSPDANRVAFSLNKICCYSLDSSVVRSRDGQRIGLGSNFQPQGWLDAQTVIGVNLTLRPPCSGCDPQPLPGHMALVHLATPTAIQDLGVTGNFLGVVQGV